MKIIAGSHLVPKLVKTSGTPVNYVNSMPPEVTVVIDFVVEWE